MIHPSPLTLSAIRIWLRVMSLGLFPPAQQLKIGFLGT